jgi:hypothetical protein
MAKRLTVPSFQEESTGNRARGAGAGGPGNFGRAFVQDTTLTDAGAGFAKLGDIMEGISAQRDSVASVKAETAALVAMDAKIGALDPLAPDYQDQVKAVAEDAKRQTLESSGITNSSVKDDLTRRMERNVASTLISAGHIQKAAVGKETERIAGESVDMISAKIRNDPGNANAYMTEFQGNMERLKIGMDPARVPAFAAAAADTFAKNQVIGYAEKGNIGGARTALKEQAQYLKGETVTGLSSYIDGRESKLRADGERAKTANAAGALLDIEDQYNGAKPIDPNMREKLDGMKARGAISPEQHLVAVRTLNNESDKYVKEAQKNAVAAEQLATGTLSSQENADRGFANQFGNVPFGRIAMQGTPEQKAAAIELSTRMASGSGYLPTQMKDLISNSDRITDTKQAATVAYAAEAVDTLETRAPGKIAGVDLKDTGVVNRVRAEAKRLMQDGVPKAEAYTQAAKTQMGTDAVTAQNDKDLRDVATDALKKIKPVDEATNAVTGFFERNIPFVTTPEVSAAMGQVWERVFKDAVVATNGNVDRAKTLANKKISDTYGPTKVGVLDAKQTEQGPGFDEFSTLVPGSTGMTGQGKVTIQAYPPEKYMNFPTLSADQKAKMVMYELDAINKKLGIAPSPSKDASGAPVVQLVPDAKTADDVRKGLPPSYQYRVLRGDIYEPVPTNNGPLRYRVPSTVDQVKENPVYMEAEQARLMRDQTSREKTIELNKPVPDAAADERAKRMKEEGRRLKGNR